MPSLEEVIKDEIRAKGPVTFARFMELALYHPELGYYSSGRGRIGKAGDFYTNSHVSPVFGRLMAEVYVSLKAALCEESCLFVEMGAGEGYFAKDFLEGLNRCHHSEYGNCRYVVIERSAGMVAKQRETLGALKDKVTWYGSLDELPSPVTGVFFSNELVDAFPFHRVHRDDGSIKEVYVGLGRERFNEVLGPLSSPLIAKYFNRLGVSLPTGMTTEVNLEACAWVRELAGRLSKGFVITVDYGYPANEYYAPERNTGTFMCYHRHTQSEKPYENIGEQDITAHVDFSSLALEGKAAKLDPLLFTDQTSFLTVALEFLHGSMSPDGYTQEELEKTGMGLKALLHPEWMGGAFKVLVQSKNAGPADAFARVPNRLSDLFKAGSEDSFRLI